MKEKALASPTVGTRSRKGQVILKPAPKGQISKVLILREKWTQIMSNCLGKCEVGKK